MQVRGRELREPDIAQRWDDMLVDKHLIGLVRDQLDAALDGIVQPPREVLGEPDVAAVGD